MSNSDRRLVSFVIKCHTNGIYFIRIAVVPILVTFYRYIIDTILELMKMIFKQVGE